MNDSQHTSIKKRLWLSSPTKNYIRHLTLKTNLTSIKTHTTSHAIKEQDLRSIEQPFGEFNRTTQGKLLLHSTTNQTSKITINTPDNLTKVRYNTCKIYFLAINITTSITASKVEYELTSAHTIKKPKTLKILLSISNLGATIATTSRIFEKAKPCASNTFSTPNPSASL